MVQVVDETADDITALIDHDFGKGVGSSDLGLRLVDWLHFRARAIPMRPRAVTRSAEVSAKLAKHPALEHIARALQRGENMEPWLSNSVRTVKADGRADPMFNDWQISHFHPRLFATHKVTKRGGDLLFAHISANRAVLIDVQPHGSWTMQELLRILLRTSPETMTGWEFKGVTAPASPRTDAELRNLRQNGYSTTVQIDGRVFMPGLGIASSRHASRLVAFRMRLARAIEDVVKRLRANNLPSPVLANIAGQIGVPVRLGIRYVAGELQVFDKNRGAVFWQSACLE